MTKKIKKCVKTGRLSKGFLHNHSFLDAFLFFEFDLDETIFTKMATNNFYFLQNTNV